MNIFKVFVVSLVILMFTLIYGSIGLSSKPNKLIENDYEMIVIDSCEYIVFRKNNRGYMAHKGNCKYCKEGK